MSNAAPAGWYADPSHPGFEHWWDGTAYTQSRPVAPAAPPAVYAPPGYAPAGYAPVGYSLAGYSPAQLMAAGISPKSRTVAAILGFFLGMLGVHRFYLGNIGMGVAMLFLSWFTLGIWPLIDWIIVLAGAARDGLGYKVTNWS
jgi:TM2 domain-containing membrane protein YozV